MNASAAAQPRHWRDPDGMHVDVRGLAQPQPLVTILTLIDSLADSTLIVHLDRDPIYLHPELAERGWFAQRIAGDADEVRLKLQRVR